MNRDLILLKVISFNAIIAVLALVFGFIFGGPKISIEFKTALILSSILFIAFLIIIVWSLITKQIYKKRTDDKCILLRYGVKVYTYTYWQGPYKYIRYPIYFGIVFWLNPGLAILFRSWLYLISIAIIYFVWKAAVDEEEAVLVKELGDRYGANYRKYRLEAPAIFPKIYQQKLLFFPLSGIAIFLIVFIFLNFPAFYLRYVEWEIAEKQIAADIKTPQRNIAEKPPSPLQFETKYDIPNSIVIEKIGVNAPLVDARSTNQKHINITLNNGVAVYPESDRPGEAGNFFVTGHSSVYPWNKTQYGQVFALLDKLEAGDIVTIYYDQYKYQYRITDKYIKAASDVWLEHPKDKSIISLMTCWPIGTNLKRMIVEGELILIHQ